jgi:hypothetical protein
VGGAPAAVSALVGGPPLPADALPAVGVAGEPAGLSLESSRCRADEGSHLSLFSRAGAGRRRVWSAYVPLGSGLEPSCAAPERAE